MMDATATTTTRVAIVGAGFMAREHVRAFASIPDVSVAGIYSRTAARAEALSVECGIPTVAKRIADLYEQTRADLVVIAVPELAVRAVMEECHQFPWIELVEKPAGYNYDDARAIAAAADQAGRRAFVALNRRYYSSTRHVQAALAADSAPRFIKIQDQEDPADALACGQPPLVVANWMYTNSIHLIDFLRLFGRGAIASVEPVIPWNAADPRVVVSRIRFDSGDEGLYEGLWNAPGPWSVSVTTAATRWELRPIEQALLLKRGERRPTPIDVESCDVDFKAGLRRQAEAAVAVARGEPSDLPTLQDALESMRLTRMIFGL
ncbi:MAG: Gfo/Idh/MocA family oxidoreductase [Gemmatimonadaceae bacterium]|nr:Gfo/Idh/MocA family oxidoreductase [Gemmatimonadaceae bacterium]